MTTEASGEAAYTADELTALEGLEAVRKRPGMYIGSKDSRGLTHLLWEILDNAVDEALAGHATRVEVRRRGDGSWQVADDGRGIPVDTNQRTGLSGVEMAMTRLHAGGKFGGGGYGAAGGLHGVGASVVNALSRRLDVEVCRDGARWRAVFARGAPVRVDADHDGDDGDATLVPVAEGEALQRVGDVDGSGTTVRFWPDPLLFDDGARIDWSEVVERARQTAFLVPGVEVVVACDADADADNAPDGAGQHHEFRFDGGVVDFVDALTSGEAVNDVIRVTGESSFTEAETDEATGESVQRDRPVLVDVALRWSSGYDTQLRSFVNVVRTPQHGTHVAGFERALTRVANEALRAHRKLKASEDNVVGDDTKEGLVAVVAVRFPEPQFEGQTKGTLGTSQVQSIVYDMVAQALRERWRVDGSAKPPRGDLAALEKVARAARTRRELRARRETIRRKNALSSTSLPPKLSDCSTRDRDSSELFVIEGDSAGGTVKAARDSSYQAVLPLRGKILNSLKASEAKMLANAECSDLIAALGAGSGANFDVDQVRYGRLVLLMDADVDGSHIRALVLTLLYRHMRPLISEGRVYSAVPPLHMLAIADAQGRRRERWYAYTDAEREQLAKRAEADGKQVRETQRYKGLGEMDADQLAETTVDAATRKLRRITLADAEEADAAFRLLMGDEVAPRRAFLIEQASRVDVADLDT